MTVYVDEIRAYPVDSMSTRVGRISLRWCHMWTDSEDLAELHQMAQQIGMRRSWFQTREGFPHYDLTPARRQRALKAGALFKPLREFIKERRWRVKQCSD